ncbi:MAG TPA: DUF3592 domain-containing protein [Chloroflexota bacterium]|nr:DUF3592 domain-containing protein [Chloroflexota bacterium]HUM71876.1 DUF3592 domain-containing protein [Chloroflexota bacterium]
MTNRVRKAETAVDTTMGCLERLRSGCLLVGFNLLFIFFIGLFLYFANRDYQLSQNGASVMGTVVGLDESDSAEGGCCVYSPIVEFRVAGQTYTFDSGNASDPPRYDVGEQVEVIYDPNNPQRAEVVGGIFWLLWAGLAGLFVVILIGMNIWGGMRIWQGKALDE